MRIQLEKSPLRPHAAGIDVGASELFVAVSADCDPQPVRSFPADEEALRALNLGSADKPFNPAFKSSPYSTSSRSGDVPLGVSL
jgi:hypothetical protein